MATPRKYFPKDYLENYPERTFSSLVTTNVAAWEFSVYSPEISPKGDWEHFPGKEFLFSGDDEWCYVGVFCLLPGKFSLRLPGKTYPERTFSSVETTNDATWEFFVYSPDNSPYDYRDNLPGKDFLFSGDDE